MKVVTEAQLERHRPSEGTCKSNHHLGLFLWGSGSAEVTPVSVCVKRDHNASTARAELSQVGSIVILFIFLKAYFIRQEYIGGNIRKKEISLHFPLLSSPRWHLLCHWGSIAWQSVKSWATKRIQNTFTSSESSIFSKGQKLGIQSVAKIALSD